MSCRLVCVCCACHAYVWCMHAHICSHAAVAVAVAGLPSSPGLFAYLFSCVAMAICVAGRRAVAKNNVKPTITKRAAAAKSKVASSTSKLAPSPSPAKSPGKITKVAQRKLDQSRTHFAKAVGDLIIADNREDTAYCKSRIDEKTLLGSPTLRVCFAEALSRR